MAEKPESDNLFMDFAVDYDRMINWPVRLKREAPFFQKVFAEGGASRILDAACGTGQHAMMFSSWGQEFIYLRMSELGQELITFNIIVLVKDEEGKWSYRVESEKLRPWTAQDIETYLSKTGYLTTGLYGDFEFRSFAPQDSTDLVIVARKS